MGKTPLRTIASDPSLDKDALHGLYVKHLSTIPQFRYGSSDRIDWYQELGDAIAVNPNTAFKTLRLLANKGDYRVSFHRSLTNNATLPTMIAFEPDLFKGNNGFLYAFCRYGRIETINLLLALNPDEFLNGVLRIINNPTLEEHSVNEIKEFTEMLLSRLQHYTFGDLNDDEEKDCRIDYGQLKELFEGLMIHTANLNDKNINYVRCELFDWLIRTMQVRKSELVPVDPFLGVASD